MLQKITALDAKADGRLGICVLPHKGGFPISVKGEEPFPLQSVMKLVVGVAVFALVDNGDVRLDDKVLVRPCDVSPGPQEFAAIVRETGGYEATVHELVSRSIIDSDSTAVDSLIAYVGGISVINRFLDEKGIIGIRVDRNERSLQGDLLGLTWRTEYSEPLTFEAAANALPVQRRDEAWEAHLNDPRDKATPIGMARFLLRLWCGELLSPVLTKKLVGIMEETATGKDRLRGGVMAGWRVAHKTGTGPLWRGVREAVNDVGVLTSPDGSAFSVVVFLAESKASIEHQEGVIAEVAALVCAGSGLGACKG